jgi:hypothetical protein
VGKWEEREGRIAGKVSKIIFSPVSAFAGEKKLHRAVQNGTVQFFFFFFFRKGKRFGGDPKMGYDKHQSKSNPYKPTSYHIQLLL